MEKRKKVIYIADSLALPRENVLYEDTAISLLKHRFRNLDFITVFKRSITTNVLVEWGGNNYGQINNFPMGSDCLEFYNPKIIILQLGIVDCAPRLLTRLDKLFIRRLSKSLADNYIKIAKRYRKRKTSNTFVSPRKFENNLLDYFDRCKRNNIEKVLIIKIPIPTKEMIDLNPLILENVTLYNRIYDSLAKKYSFIKCLNPLSPSKYDINIYVDGYHPNKKGNFFVFKALEPELL